MKPLLSSVSAFQSVLNRLCDFFFFMRKVKKKTTPEREKLLLRLVSYDSFHRIK